MARQAQEEVEEPKPDAVARAASSLRSGLPQFLLLGSAARPTPGQPRPYEPRIATLSDIRVVQDPENYAKILGEVETTETVNEQTALRRWRPFADLAPLYIYVPVGDADHALKLCRELRVPIVGVRTWRYAVGVEEIEVNDHYTVASGPEELLPKILRPG